MVGTTRACKAQYAGFAGEDIASTTLLTAEATIALLTGQSNAFLKAAGVTDALAREIIGHESAAISRAYTHLNTEDIRPSINKLPDVSKKEEKPK